MAQSAETLCLNDNCYNTVHQLAQTLKFLSRVDQFIDDAKKAKDNNAQTAWQTIKDDRKKHAEILRELAVNQMKNRQF